MRVLQVSPTTDRHSGVAVFADSMARAFATVGVDVTTVTALDGPSEADLVLVQQHENLVTAAELRVIAEQAQRPVVLLTHSAGFEPVLGHVAGTMAMVPGLVASAPGLPTHLFPHPAYAPDELDDRRDIRPGLRLPVDRRIVSTSGFLRFERQLPQTLAYLLPQAAELGWLVQLVTSPWYIPSPGLLDEIAAVGSRYPEHFRHWHEHLSTEKLNLRLQASDLLWCWSKAAPAPYASGVVSQMYGSGTRIVAADRLQHEHVLRLPNVVRGPTTLSGFVDEVVRQMREGDQPRHDPSPVSWNVLIRDITHFLSGVLAVPA
jgi:hypothetical protein